MQWTIGQPAQRVFTREVVPRIDDRIELRIDPLGPLDRFLEQLTGRDLTITHHPRQLDRVEIGVSLYCHVGTFQTSASLMRRTILCMVSTPSDRVRPDGRQPHEPRPIHFQLGVQRHANGSCIVSLGETQVLCAVSISEDVPRWLEGQGRGWLTAEYNMLPASTNTRSDRDRVLAAGRTKEIQRLIGRSLRAALDLHALGEQLLTVDCDVLNADGGTRTAAVIGSYVALVSALGPDHPALIQQVAAISIGIHDSVVLTDLNYEEDSSAHVDCNIVGLSDSSLVEVQATAEGRAFTQTQLADMLGAAQSALEDIFVAQRDALAQK